MKQMVEVEVYPTRCDGYITSSTTLKEVKERAESLMQELGEDVSIVFCADRDVEPYERLYVMRLENDVEYKKRLLREERVARADYDLYLSLKKKYEST